MTSSIRHDVWLKNFNEAYTTQYLYSYYTNSTKKNVISVLFLVSVCVYAPRYTETMLFIETGALHAWQPRPNEDTVRAWWYLVWSTRRTCFLYFFVMARQSQEPPVTTPLRLQFETPLRFLFETPAISHVGTFPIHWYLDNPTMSCSGRHVFDQIMSNEAFSIQFIFTIYTKPTCEKAEVCVLSVYFLSVFSVSMFNVFSLCLVRVCFVCLSLFVLMCFSVCFLLVFSLGVLYFGLFSLCAFSFCVFSLRVLSMCFLSMCFRYACFCVRVCVFSVCVCVCLCVKVCFLCVFPCACFHCVVLWVNAFGATYTFSNTLCIACIGNNTLLAHNAEYTHCLHCFPDIRCLVFFKFIAVSVEFLRGVLSSLATEPNHLQLIDKYLPRGLVEMVYHPRDRMFLGLCERCQVG